LLVEVKPLLLGNDLRWRSQTDPSVARRVGWKVSQL